MRRILLLRFLTSTLHAQTAAGFTYDRPTRRGAVLEAGLDPLILSAGVPVRF